MLKLAFIPYFTMSIYEFPVKKELNPPPSPGAHHGRKIKVAGLLGQQFLVKIKNCGRRFTLNWLECFGWRRSFNNFIGSSFFFASNWRQSYLATLVTPQNCTSYFSGTICIFFSTRPFFFVLEQLLSNFRHKKHLLIVFWPTFEQLSKKLWEPFSKFRDICGKPCKRWRVPGFTK